MGCINVSLVTLSKASNCFNETYKNHQFIKEPHLYISIKFFGYLTTKPNK